MTSRLFPVLFAVSSLGTILLGMLAVTLGIQHAAPLSVPSHALPPLIAAAAGAALITTGSYAALRFVHSWTQRRRPLHHDRRTTQPPSQRDAHAAWLAFATPRAKILIVEDEPLFASTLARATDRYFEPTCVGSKAAAFAQLDHADVAAAIVDVNLPDGNGLDVVAQLRERHSDLPILVLTGSSEPSTISRAQVLRADFCPNPFFTENVAGFVQRALVRSSQPKDKLESEVAQLTLDKQLSSREAQILILSVKGIPRRQLAEVLGVSENTVTTQIRSLLEKLDGAQTMREAVLALHAAAGDAPRRRRATS